MAQPPIYTRQNDFSADELNNTGGRATVRTAQLDAELDAISLTVNATSTNLGLIQRDDGKLRDGSVGTQTLDGNLGALIASGRANLLGPWVTATSYAANDWVTQGSSVYACAIPHTSGTFATDAAAGRWWLIQAASNGVNLADASTPTNGSGAVAHGDTTAYPTSSIGFVIQSTAMRGHIFSLGIIPRSEWAAILAGTSSYDCTAAVTAFNALPGPGYLPAGVIRSSEPIRLNGKTVYCDGTRFVKLDTLSNDPGVWITGSGSKLLGDLTIDMPSGAWGTLTNAFNFVHVLVGGGLNYTDGATNVEIGSVTLTGGRHIASNDPMPGVLVMGACRNVSVKRIYSPDKTFMFTPFGCHWGNFTDHYLSGSDYVHPGPNPTTHPDGVWVGEVIAGNCGTTTGIANAAVFISSSRNVRVDKIRVDGCYHGVVVFPGDIGFEYASAADKVRKMYGISFGEIDVRAAGRAFSAYGVSTYPSVASSNALVEVTVERINGFYAGVGASTTQCVYLDTVRYANIQHVWGRSFSETFSVGVACTFVHCEELVSDGSVKQAVLVAGTLSSPIGTVIIDAVDIVNANTGGSADDYVGAAIAASRVDAFFVNGGRVGYSGETAKHAVTVLATASGGCVSNLRVNGCTSTAINNDIGCMVLFKGNSFASGITPYGGWGFVPFEIGLGGAVMAWGNAAPLSGTWARGSRVINATSSVGQPKQWDNTAGGSPGTWASEGNL